MLWIVLNREECEAIDISGKRLGVESWPDEKAPKGEMHRLYVARYNDRREPIYISPEKDLVVGLFLEIIWQMSERRPRLHSRMSGYGGAVLEYHMDGVLDLQELIHNVNVAIQKAAEKKKSLTEYYREGWRDR